MKLKDFLKKEGLTYAKFAEMLGDEIQGQSLKNIACGNRRPSLKLALKIEQVTKGKVAPKDLLENNSKADS